MAPRPTSGTFQKGERALSLAWHERAGGEGGGARRTGRGRAAGTRGRADLNSGLYSLYIIWPIV